MNVGPLLSHNSWNVENLSPFSDNLYKSSEFSEKLNILWSWKEKIMINNLDSKIINGNEKYNEALKIG